MKTNDLIHETSPYLLQHANNPVNWVAWSQKAFQKAKEENKLVLVSIGYSACHWCHVMEHESFESDEVAEIMNAHFINIKVDREERPDVDMLYMSAVQLMTGQGGWPLNCFVLPDGRPIYGGTYFKKEQWISILKNLQKLFANESEKVEQYAQELTEGIKQNELIYTKSAPDSRLLKSVLIKCVENWKKRFDTNLGGPKRAPKFPMPNNYSFLLKYAYLSGDEDVLKHVNLTLQKMAHGGIYDQIAGGFSRYSVDMEWKVPHFEKMLYDNSQLINLYCEAYRYTKNELYKDVVLETIKFVEEEWLSVENGFYSALDADSEGEEGKYYVWQKEELELVLGEDFELFSKYYQVNEVGHWEHGNYILIKIDQIADICVQFKISKAELKNKINSCLSQLKKERLKRIKPGLDNKIILAWNGLMCKALCEAALTFNSNHFKNLALKNAEFIHREFINEDFSVNRTYGKNRKAITGFLDDYAFCIDSFISVYYLTQDEKWLNTCSKLSEYCIHHFYNSETNLFYYTSKDSESLAVRTTEVSDNVIPSSNSQMAYNLFKLDKIFASNKYETTYTGMLGNLNEEIVNYGSGYSNWATLYLDIVYGVAEVCIVGKDVDEKMRELYNYYLPNAIFVVSSSESELEILKMRHVLDKTVIYVCQNKTCQLPTEDVKEAVKQIEAIS